MVITSEEILEMSSAIKASIATHEVPKSLRDSLLQDIVFHVATMVDSAQGTEIHESIFAELEKYEPPESDNLVAELFIELEGGEELEANILYSDITRPENLRLNLELLFELRDISDLESEIDCEEGFRKIKISKIYIESVTGKTEDLGSNFVSLSDLERSVTTTSKKWV